ncbi:YraN family protein [Gordonia bronchialis]|uniref:YraN family protein n=1 Tax=Gordonia bronchialis TaxID=2054 RepID=UPI001CBE6AF1|nr:YraN family protein [Gordonia bronchialis]UAK38743.1 YraN family protein [Gordonia bronchialis]
MTAHSAAEPGPRRTDRRRHIGRLGEDIAAEFVTNRGWRVLHRNWRNRYGELDLIAADGRVLVVVEVKTRASLMYSDPLEAVTPAKLSRMRKLTRMWLSEQNGSWSQIRFDVISVQLDPHHPDDRASARIRHHLGVFV